MTKLLILIVTCALGRVSGFAPNSQPRRGISNSRLHATWSDSRAVREYQDFLSTGKQEIEKEDDGQCVIVTPSEGPTQVARTMFALGQGDDLVLAPDQDVPESLGGTESFPVYVALPPTQLADFLRNMPAGYKKRTADLCFFSGGLECGNIEGVLKDFGYSRDATTQILLTGVRYTTHLVEDISVKIGTASNGENKWAGECAACGKWSGAIERRLERNAARCKTVFFREWKRLMWEQHMYDTVLHLVGAVRSEPTSVADVANYYDAEVSDILWEISGLLRGSRAITLTYGFEERLFGVAEARGSDVACTLVDDPEMYPFLYEPFEMAKTFMEYLTYSQDECGLLPSVSIFRKSATLMERPPIIKTGNLRADGVV